MDINEKDIRRREAATAYVRGERHHDRTALIVLLDRERVKSAAMLAALKCAQALDARNGEAVLIAHGWNRECETATAFVARLMRGAVDSAEGRTHE